MRRIRLCPHWRWYLHGQGLALPRLERPEGWPGERNRWLRYQPFPGWQYPGLLGISGAVLCSYASHSFSKTIVTRLVQEVNLKWFSFFRLLYGKWARIASQWDPDTCGWSPKSPDLWTRWDKPQNFSFIMDWESPYSVFTNSDARFCI